MNQDLTTRRCNASSKMAMHFAARYQDGEYVKHEGLTWKVIGAKVVGSTHVDFTLKRIPNYRVN